MRPLSGLKTFVERYQHQISIGSFLVGFAVDTVILKRIDLLISNALLLSYLTIVVVSMLLLHVAASHPPRVSILARIYEWIPFAAQFAFGGMFSGFLIFYSQSGTLFASWPFLTLIIALIISNEFLRTYQSRLTYQSLLLFFCIFSFAIYAVPIFAGHMGDIIFELSGAVALIAIAGFLALLWFIDKRRVRTSLGSIITGVIAIYGLITALYFSNILPPIPLALKDIGVYHTLVRVGDHYEAQVEEAPWHRVFSVQTLSVFSSDYLYAYSSVFAPTKLSTAIVHRWERSVSGEWVTVTTVPFGITGGRDGGYRGYSILGPVEPGLWRVNVETTRGQLIGRTTFKAVRAVSTPTLSTRILD